MNKVPVLLFAAGKGTRMGALTANQPKPMVRVAGRPLIDHALDLTKRPDLQTPVINTHYCANVLHDYLAGQDVIFSDEADLLRETGGGLRFALPHLQGSPVITLNTDAVWRGDNPLAVLLSHWTNDMEALLLTVPRDNALGHSGNGDFIRNTDQRLTRGPGEVYTGAQMIRTDNLSQITKDVFSMNEFWDLIAQRDGLFGASYHGKWCDVGRPDSIPIAEAMLRGHDV